MKNKFSRRSFIKGVGATALGTGMMMGLSGCNDSKSNDSEDVNLSAPSGDVLLSDRAIYLGGAFPAAMTHLYSGVTTFLRILKQKHAQIKQAGESDLNIIEAASPVGLSALSYVQKGTANGGFSDDNPDGGYDIVNTALYYHPAGDGSSTRDFNLDAYHLFTALPFGMLPTEFWAYYKGENVPGQSPESILDEVGAIDNVKPFLTHNSGYQAFGMFNKVIPDLDTFKSVKYRVPGTAKKILVNLGMDVLSLSGGQLKGAMEDGTLDGFEWVGPKEVITHPFGGAHYTWKNCTHYYVTPFGEPGANTGLLFNLEFYNSLTAEHQRIVREAADEAYLENLNAAFYQDEIGLEVMLNVEGLTISELPESVGVELFAETTKFLDNTESFPDSPDLPQSLQFNTLYEGYKSFMLEYRNQVFQEVLGRDYSHNYSDFMRFLKLPRHRYYGNLLD